MKWAPGSAWCWNLIAPICLTPKLQSGARASAGMALTYLDRILHAERVCINGLVQDCSNFIALAMELLQSCAKPSKYSICTLSFTGYFLSTSIIHLSIYFCIDIVITPINFEWNGPRWWISKQKYDWGSFPQLLTSPFGRWFPDFAGRTTSIVDLDQHFLRHIGTQGFLLLVWWRFPARV